MGDLSKLKVAIGQPEIVEGRPSRNEAAIDRMVDMALDEGADILVVPGSLKDPSDIRLIGLNDSRVDVAGNMVLIDACGESYRIAMGHTDADCDFAVMSDLAPYTLRSAKQVAPAATVLLRPVGMLDLGKKVLCYDGGTSASRPDGTTVAKLRDDFSESCATFSFIGDARIDAPCRKKPLTSIVATMRRFDDLVLNSAMKWVIGLSGGLDSSVVAALLVLAFGSERVVAYNMSSRYNSSATKRNAVRCAERLGIRSRSGSIEGLVRATGSTLGDFGYDANALSGMVLENAQARIRGNLLSTFAALEGGVVANNGNRVECALGYATLYGDAIGALAPIGDLTKVQLFDIARDINDTFGYEVIPGNLLPVETHDGYLWETVPSAELSDGQVDPMKWFYHDWLIGQLLGDDLPLGTTLDEAACTVLEQYLDDRLESSAVGKWIGYYGLDNPRSFIDDFQWIVHSVRASAFKRVQAPPRIAVASLASIQPDCEPQISPEPSSRYRALLAQLRRA